MSDDRHALRRAAKAQKAYMRALDSYMAALGVSEAEFEARVAEINAARAARSSVSERPTQCTGS